MVRGFTIHFFGEARFCTSMVNTRNTTKQTKKKILLRLANIMRCNRILTHEILSFFFRSHTEQNALIQCTLVLISIFMIIADQILWTYIFCYYYYYYSTGAILRLCSKSEASPVVQEPKNYSLKNILKC